MTAGCADPASAIVEAAGEEGSLTPSSSVSTVGSTLGGEARGSSGCVFPRGAIADGLTTLGPLGRDERRDKLVAAAETVATVLRTAL